MHNENGNGVNIDLDRKPYHSADSGFACAAAGHGIPEAVRTHIDVIVRNEELEIASNHEQIRRELNLLRDNKNTLEASQQNYQKKIKESEQEIAAKDVSLAELKAKLEAPAEMEVMPSLDPVLEALRDEKKEQERELADKKITHATLRVASKAPTLVELSLKAIALPGSGVVSEVPALAESSPIPLKPGLSIRQLCVAIGATLASIMLLCYLYVFYSSVAEKAFAPKYEQQNYEQANNEQIDEQALNQFVDPRALQEAWKSPKNWFVLLFPMVFVAFAYVAHFCLNRVMEGNPKWFIWLIIVLGVTLGLDGIIATNIASNIQDIKMKAESYAPGTFTDIESTWKDVISVILLGFTVSLLLSGSLYCTLQEWGDVRPMAKQIKAEKNERKVKLAELRAEIEALEHDINSLDTQIAAQIKAHRHPLQVEIDRITVETENLNKEVKALDEVAARIQSEIGKCQTKIDELEEALKHPERKSIDLKKMEAHVNDFVSGWCRFVAQRKTELPDDLPTQIKDIRTTAHQTLEDYKAALPV